MPRRFSLILAVFFAAFLGLNTGKLFAQAAPPAEAKPLDVQQNDKASALLNAQKYAEAYTAYEAIPKNYPTSIYVPEATFRMGYIDFLLGNYDKSVATLEKVPNLKNVTPEQKSAALALAPQVLTAKASKLGPDDPARKAAFQDAVSKFDIFLKEFPNAEEAESATYYKALALYQIGQYDDAVTALKGSVQKFAASPTVLDSQYLLALTLGTLATTKAQKATTADPSINANYDDAEKFLNDIITKQTDIALVNDARLQIGELSFAHAAFLKDAAQRKAMLTKALDYYRLVAPKEAVIQAQTLRIKRFEDEQIAIGKRADTVGYKRMQRVIEKEREKLATFQERPDQTVLAKFKSGQAFFQLGRYDEARVIFEFVKPFITDADQVKQLALNVALSYAVEDFDPKVSPAAAAKAANDKLSDLAVKAYTDFRSAYSHDPIGDNLALLVGARFIEEDPEKAIGYFKESLDDYPNGRFKIQALTQQAAALTRLQKYDEALNLFKKTQAESPSKEISAAAEFGIATVHRSTGKLDDAIKEFKQVRDQYAGAPEAEQAAFFLAQTIQEKGELKAAVPELQAFLKKFPESTLAPMALYTQAQIQLQLGQKKEALATFKDVSTKYPQSDVGSYSYFDRARAANGDQHFEECVAIMKAFIAAYPNSPQLYDAYDFMAQIDVAQSKPADAIAVYEEYVNQKSTDVNTPRALLRIAGLWQGMLEKLPSYIALNVDQRKDWEQDSANALAAAEKVVDQFPESPQVALALDSLLESQKRRVKAKLMTQADVEKYFQDLSKKFESKPSTRSKVIFTLARDTFDQDKAKAIQEMSTAYDPILRYAPRDLDLYGEALLQSNKLDDARKVYEKLATDYPTPKGVDPTKAPRDVQEAQAISLFGAGRVLQEQKKSAESKEKFDTLKQMYPWSPKLLEANYGIAASLFEQKNYPDALKLLVAVTRSSQAPSELRAKSMFLLAKINEAQQDYSAAINNYLKIEADFGRGAPALSAEGLWRGAQLLEKEGNGEIAMPTPPPAPLKGTPKAAPKPPQH